MFDQAVVFCNSRPDGEYLADKLAAAGMPAAFLAGGQSQAERMRTMGAVRGFRLRVIVTTDLVGLMHKPPAADRHVLVPCKMALSQRCAQTKFEKSAA